MESAYELVLNPSQLSLSLSTAVATYLGYKCFKAPRRVNNANTKVPKDKHDSLRQLYLTQVLHMYRFFVIMSGACRFLFTLIQPREPSVVCPYPENLDHDLFDWSVYNFVSILLIIIGGGIRMLAYRQLGANYTFELNKSDRLVVDGIYKHIQHPGYSGGWTAVVGILAFFGRFDGGLGCYTPASMSRVCSMINMVVIASTMAFIFQVRIGEEESLLRKTFGQQWIAYNKRTKRFLPWIV